MKNTNKYKKPLKTAIFTALSLLLFSGYSQAHERNHVATSDTLTLSQGSIIDSIDRLGKLQFHLPKTQYFVTQNGVEVAFTPLNQLPIVDVSVSFSSGSAYDEQIRPLGFGIANMTATMLTQGTKQLSEDEFVAKKESLGIKLSSGATKDDLQITLRSLSDENILNQAVELLYDALSEPAFDNQVLQRNQQRLITTLKQSRQNPAYIASIQFNKLIFNNHPYAMPVTGDEQSVPAITREDLLEFYQKYIGKQTAKISITGNLTVAQAKQVAQRIEDGLSVLNAKPTPIKTSQNQMSRRHVHIHHPSTQTQVIIGHQTEKNLTDANSLQKATDFMLANDVLAGRDFNAKLMKHIREEKGYTYGIYGNIDRSKFGGVYRVQFSTKAEQAKDAITETIAVIEQTLNQGIDQSELQLARLNNKNGFPETFSSNASIHRTVHQLFVMDYPKSHLADRAMRLDRTSLSLANAALQETIRPNEFLIVTVGSQKPDLSHLLP